MNDTTRLSDTGMPPSVDFWIRTPCGRAKYQELAGRPGSLARFRLGWFVLIAALRDLGQPLPQTEGEGGGGGGGASGGPAG
jgi:hypothetical protein